MSAASDYLEDKFVRFSYRFRFDDNEYSLFAPFTQAAYIPKQDGFFLDGDEDKAYRSTISPIILLKINKFLPREYLYIIRQTS